MNFQDILNQPLPSKANAEEACLAKEDDILSDDELNEIDSMDVDMDDVDDAEDDFDPDELDEDELANLDLALGDDEADMVSKIPNVDDDPVKLSPSEAMNADDMMSSAATTLLVNDELNANERAEFVNSGEAEVAVKEGFMTDMDLNYLSENTEIATEAAKKYTNKMVIRLNLAAKRKQLFALAVNVSAAAHHDPDYIRLKKVLRMRKILRARLQQKYKGEAEQRCKIYFARLRQSKSSILSKLGKKHSK